MGDQPSALQERSRATDTHHSREATGLDISTNGRLYVRQTDEQAKQFYGIHKNDRYFQNLNFF